jgi:DNA-binding NtrC family response regulator
MSGPDQQELLGRSGAMERVRRFARRAGRTGVPVLITGETGTGKSLLARIIHRQGERRRAPFVAINCAGIPEGLFESEFFGHRRGAFTGAMDHRRGLVESAHGGTLFLDEVADLPLSQQAKLLTVIEEGQVRRVGEERPIDVDVRLISATSVDIPRAMVEGGFRPDLYHRLALLRCTLPPLRERPEDILVMADGLIQSLARKHKHPHPHLLPEVRALLLRYTWPGNVRELAHVLEAALILSEDAPLDLDHLAEAMSFTAPAVQVHPSGPVAEAYAPESASIPGSPAGSPPPTPLDGRCEEGVEPALPGAKALRGVMHTGGSPLRGGDEPVQVQTHFERDRITEALERHSGDRAAAARDLGMARSTLRTRILRYGLETSR